MILVIFPLFFGSGQIPQSMAGVGITVLKMFIRMRKVEIGEKLKTLLNQRLRIHPSHLKWFFRYFEARGPIFGGPGIGQFGGFWWILRISTIFVKNLRNWELGASPDGILGSFIKQNEFRSISEPAKSGGESKTLNFLYFYWFYWKSIENQQSQWFYSYSWGLVQIHWSLAGGGVTVLKKFIRMRKVEIGEKLKKLLNQRLRIVPSHLK